MIGYRTEGGFPCFQVGIPRVFSCTVFCILIQIVYTKVLGHSNAQFTRLSSDIPCFCAVNVQVWISKNIRALQKYMYINYLVSWNQRGNSWVRILPRFNGL